MSISATTSHVYVNYSSFFLQGNNKTFSTLQAAVANYSNNTSQGNNATVSTSDILDLSQEGLAQSLASPSIAAGTTDNTETATETVNNVTLGTPELSESERVETIRVNKNAVLERVNEILEEKGIELSENQAFDLTANFLDGTLSVTGIEDAELAATVNEALAGDEELLDLMKKTRNELGLAEPANTVSRNFTIGFDSMLETPAGTELEYKIDLFVNQPTALPEETANTEIANTESLENTDSTTSPTEQLTFYLSILLSNKTNSDLDLLTALENNKSSENKKDSKLENTQENNKEQENNEETVQTKTPDFIPDEEQPVELPVETVSAIFPSSVFGSYFQAGSVIEIGADGVTLDWNLQFSNWSNSANTANNTTNNSESSNKIQQIFETLNITGSAFYAYDSQNPQSFEEQAAEFQSQFVNGFSQGLKSSWAENFIAQNGLNLLGIFT
ncbi:MAG: hypothetical protein LBC20_01445 [Planctomycetaceae bacterium]|jgi:hypothetical protein|nr:hypothetical protein [Planctomycetaceae bacterium]